LSAEISSKIAKPEGFVIPAGHKLTDQTIYELRFSQLILISRTLKHTELLCEQSEKNLTKFYFR